MENLCSFSHHTSTSLLSFWSCIFSNEQLFAIIHSLVELKKREIESKLSQQKLFISQIELDRKIIDNEITQVRHDLMDMRNIVSNLQFGIPFKRKIPKEERKIKEETILKELSFNSTYKYKISLACDLPLQLYKDKPFNIFFNINHIKTERLIKNIEHLNFHIVLLKSDKSPQIIHRNLLGKDIISYDSLNFHSKFPGCIELHQTRIKEVSSHFIKGWFYLCLNANDATNEQDKSKIEDNNGKDKKYRKFHETEEDDEEEKIKNLSIKYQKIKAEEIKPMVIPHLVVKSKKRR